MSIDLADFRSRAKAAVKAFWQNRDTAQRKQLKSGRMDAGERAGVTAGKNMDGFLSLAIEIVRTNGLQEADIHLARRALTLPGFFRPTKIWDLLVCRRGRLVAAVELKSQAGPSFGNNFNNRTEEAIGAAVDFWTAYREGAFGDQNRPFLGWLMLLEDCEGSRAPVRNSSTHFPVFREFEGASYAKRYDILCRKLQQEGLYTSTALLLSPKSSSEDGQFSELSQMTGLKNFASTLAGHVAAEAARET